MLISQGTWLSQLLWNSSDLGYFPEEKKPYMIRPIDINIDAKPNACINKSAAYEPG